MTKYLIIGAGKLAKHLHHYFSLLGLRPQHWDRSQDPHLLRTKINDATHILLAISDSTIESFYRQHLAGLDKVVVHFSGALHIPELIAAHPLMSFGPELYSHETYRQIHFTLSGATDLRRPLPGLPNAFTVLPPEHKPLYHALCVLGGNFPVILWQKMFAEFAKLGIPPEASRPYLETVLRNTLANPSQALTGPLARHDQVTVLKNIEALEDDPFQKIYFAFVETIAPELLAQNPIKRRPHEHS